MRHAPCWTKDYEKCVADGMSNCTGVDEEVRVACDCYYEDVGQRRGAPMSKSTKPTKTG